MAQLAYPRRVLVVDGNVDSAAALIELLRMNGYEARAARDGPSCLVDAANFSPHVICSSIKMHGMSGLELGRELRKKSEIRGVLLIATTGLRSDWIATEIISAGFDIALRKPLDFDKFFAVLDAFFEDKGLYNPSASAELGDTCAATSAEGLNFTQTVDKGQKNGTKN